MPNGNADEPLGFGRFEIAPAERVLRVDGKPVAVGARAFDLLLVLARQRERLVSREELLDQVWPGVMVEEHNITAQISSLRKLLGRDVIATVPGRGYRFTAVAAPAPGNPASSPEPRRPAHNLPEPRTRFIGRESALADIAGLLPQTRLLTLTGIGGSGKTRLALQYARGHLVEFGDGVWFVELATLDDPTRVASACASALGLPRESDLPLEAFVADWLAARSALIVLDNCEHVRPGAARLADALLARPGQARILATSREPLGVAGEQLYAVHPLSLPTATDLESMLAADAVKVFIDRARLELPEFDLDRDNAATIVEICRQLDGIALAIELAAARVTMLPVSDIAARLRDRFRLLAGGSFVIARQQTMLATLQWSHDLLEADEQRALRRLSVFAGGWTLEAAAAITEAGDEYEALAWLTALHDKSLLVVDRSAKTVVRGALRYRMLETVRQYARERLDESGEAETVSRLHAEYFLTFAEAAGRHLRGPDQPRWMTRLRAEQENLVAAVTWCTRTPSVNPQWSLRLVGATARYWIFNDIDLGSRLSLAALACDTQAADGPARWHALYGLAAMCGHRGRSEQGLAHARQALEMAERAGNLEWRAMALLSVGTCLSSEDSTEAALHCYAQAADFAQQAGHATLLSHARNNTAEIERSLGRFESAEQNYRQSLRIARGQGDILASVITLHNLVRLLVDTGRPDQARACALESASLLAESGEFVMRIELLEVIADLASSQSRHELAARWWGSSRPRMTEAGYRHPPGDETRLAHLMAAARQAYGEDGFDAAYAAGRALPIEDALGEMLAWLEAEGASTAAATPRLDAPELAPPPARR